MSANNLFTLQSFTQSTNTLDATSISSIEGKVGAIRMLESSGSFPYGKVAPASVIISERTSWIGYNRVTIF